MFEPSNILGSKVLYSGTSNHMSIEEWRCYLGFAGYEGQVKRHRAVLAISANRFRHIHDLGTYGWTMDGTPMRLAWDYFNGEWVSMAELAALYCCDVADVLSYRQFAKLEAANWVFDDADHLNAWTARMREIEWQNALWEPGPPDPRLDFPPHAEELRVRKSVEKGRKKEAKDRAAHEANIQADMTEIDRAMGRAPPLTFSQSSAPGTRTSGRTRTRTGKAQAIDESEDLMPASRTRAAKGKGKGKGKGKEIATDTNDAPNAKGDVEEVVDSVEDAGAAIENAGDAVGSGEDTTVAAEEPVRGKKRKFEGILESIEEGDEAEEDLAPPAKRSRGGTPDISATNTAAETVVQDEKMGEAREAAGQKEVPAKEKKKRGRKPAAKKTDAPPTRVTRSMSRQRSEAPHGVATDGPSDAPANLSVNLPARPPADAPVRRSMSRHRSEGPHGVPSAVPANPSVNLPAGPPVRRPMSRQRSEGPHGVTADGPSDALPNPPVNPPAAPPVRRSTRSQRERSVTAKAAQLQEGGKWKKGAK